MSDSAHIQNKSPVGLFESRDLTVLVVTNPTSESIENYRTAIDPALVASKPVPADVRALDANNEPIPVWLSDYATGVSPAEILYKNNLGPGSSQNILIGDGPDIHDLGTMLIPGIDPDQPGLRDAWHKTVATDLAPGDFVIAASAEFHALPYITSLVSTYDSQAMLFPVSARHIVKTPNGDLHAVATYEFSGRRRVAYLKSTTGGASWTYTLIDNDDGMEYITPSITCDKNGGIHITYTRWDNVITPTFWLYAGGSTPAGFDLISDVGGQANQRILAGGQGVSDPLTFNQHSHTATISNPSSTGCQIVLLFSTNGTAYCGWHHTTSSFSIGDAVTTPLPPYRTLKLLRYNGIPQSLPADIIIPFTVNVPGGFTRYSAQDNLYIFGSNAIGTTGGATIHYHACTGSISGGVSRGGGYGPVSSNGAAYNHAHTLSGNSPTASNIPPSQGVILGHIASPITTIPDNALLMFGNEITNSLFTLLSGVGGPLENRALVGSPTYSSIAGSLTHVHANHTIASSVGNKCLTIYENDTGNTLVRCNHIHNILFSNYSSAYTATAWFAPYIYEVASDLDTTTFGNDLFYRYISPDGTVSSPVNISQIYQYFPSIEGVCLVDGDDNQHFLWSCQGVNANPAEARISYKKQTSGVLGPRVDLTSSDHMLYPSMDIDHQGDVHTAWWNTTTNQSIQYCKISGGVPGVVENALVASYCGYPSNLIVDKDLNVHLFFCGWTDPVTPIRDMGYLMRTNGVGWGASINMSPGKAAAGYDQFTGQQFMDNKGNIVYVWSGEGYGAHTSVYHPVYRYITKEGTVVPPLGEDAVDVFPDDDTEMIYPIVFWHSFPLTQSVYHNLPVSGLTFIYLYNPRGLNKSTADIRFHSTKDALVGDVGDAGEGGSGDSSITPGGVAAESILQQESITISQRGYIGRSSMSQSTFGSYIS